MKIRTPRYTLIVVTSVIALMFAVTGWWPPAVQYFANRVMFSGPEIFLSAIAHGATEEEPREGVIRDDSIIASMRETRRQLTTAPGTARPAETDVVNHIDTRVWAPFRSSDFAAWSYSKTECIGCVYLYTAKSNYYARVTDPARGYCQHFPEDFTVPTQGARLAGIFMGSIIMNMLAHDPIMKLPEPAVIKAQWGRIAKQAAVQMEKASRTAQKTAAVLFAVAFFFITRLLLPSGVRRTRLTRQTSGALRCVRTATMLTALIAGAGILLARHQPFADWLTNKMILEAAPLTFIRMVGSGETDAPLAGVIQGEIMYNSEIMAEKKDGQPHTIQTGNGTSAAHGVHSAATILAVDYKGDEEFGCFALFADEARLAALQWSAYACAPVPANTQLTRANVADVVGQSELFKMMLLNFYPDKGTIDPTMILKRLAKIMDITNRLYAGQAKRIQGWCAGVLASVLVLIGFGLARLYRPARSITASRLGALRRAARAYATGTTFDWIRMRAHQAAHERAEEIRRRVDLLKQAQSFDDVDFTEKISQLLADGDEDKARREICVMREKSTILCGVGQVLKTGDPGWDVLSAVVNAYNEFGYQTAQEILKQAEADVAMINEIADEATANLVRAAFGHDKREEAERIAHRALNIQKIAADLKRLAEAVDNLPEWISVRADFRSNLSYLQVRSAQANRLDRTGLRNLVSAVHDLEKKVSEAQTHAAAGKHRSASNGANGVH